MMYDKDGKPYFDYVTIERLARMAVANQIPDITDSDAECAVWEMLRMVLCNKE